MALQHLQTRTNTANQAYYTFPTGNLGAVASDRHIIVAVSTRQLTNIGLSGIFVDGNPAEYIVKDNRAGEEVSTGIGIVSLPDNITTGNINVGWDSSVGRCTIDVWRVDNLSSAQPFYTGVAAYPASEPSLAASKPVGATIGIAATARNDAVATWDGLTLLHSSIVESLTYTAAYEESVVSGTGLISCSFSPAGVSSSLSVAAWAYNTDTEFTPQINTIYRLLLS